MEETTIEWHIKDRDGHSGQKEYMGKDMKSWTYELFCREGKQSLCLGHKVVLEQKEQGEKNTKHLLGSHTCPNLLTCVIYGP